MGIEICYFWLPNKTYKHLLINSPVSGHPPHFSLVSAYGNNSRKWVALLADTFFNTQGCPLTRELTVCQILYVEGGKLKSPDKNPQGGDNNPCYGYLLILVVTIVNVFSYLLIFLYSSAHFSSLAKEHP